VSFEEKMNKINHEIIKNTYIKLGNISDDIVFNSYSKIMEFVKRNNSIKDKITLIGIAHVAYGWMPTMLDKIDLKLIENNGKIKKIWDNIQSGSMDYDFLLSIKNIVNNSIIGGSKLLHFINPNDYAIIDSNIVSFLLKKKNVFVDCNIENYIIFMNRIKDLIKNKEEMNKIKEIFHENNRNIESFSDTRYIEMALFYSGKIEKRFNGT